MFTAYPDQQRPRCGRPRWLVLGCGIATISLFSLAEWAFQKKRRVDTKAKDLHFLQPFLYSPGFEVGLWTWHRGLMNEPHDRVAATTDMPGEDQDFPEEDDAKQAKAGDKQTKHVLTAAEVEVGRLRAELEAERVRSALQREQLERLAQEARRKKAKTANAGMQDRGKQSSPGTTPIPLVVSTRTGTPLPEISQEEVTTNIAKSKAEEVDESKPEEKLRIPSSLFRQPPALEALQTTSLQPEPPPLVAVENAKTSKKETVAPTPSAPVVTSAEAPAAEQPVITLKAGGSKIHVKLGEASSAPQQQVQPTTKEEATVQKPSERAADAATTTSTTKLVETLGLSLEAPASNTSSARVASDVALVAGTGAAVEASPGTSITLKTQGQTITIQFDSGVKDQKAEIAQSPTVSPPAQQPSEAMQSPSVTMESSAVALPLQRSPAQEVAKAPAPAVAATPMHVPAPIGTPAPEALSIPSGALRHSSSEHAVTVALPPSARGQDTAEQPKVVSIELSITATTTTTAETTTTSTVASEEDRYANLALRAR